MKCDFSGYATRNDLVCGDGRVIKQNAFKDDDGRTVPLVWNHQHNDPESVLGHAVLENRDDGVYAYGVFNDTERGKEAKHLVEHGDVRSLSIWANKLKQNGSDVIHGCIRELSLVLAGANPGAYIDFVVGHSDDTEDGFEACYDEYITIHHSDEEGEKIKMDEKEKKETPETKPATDDGKTVEQVYNTLDDDQKKLVELLIAVAVEDAVGEDGGDTEKDEGEEDMKHNAFDVEENEQDTLMHDGMEMIISDAKRCGSMKESFLAHAQDYGIENIEYLFPDAKNVQDAPVFISRDMDWVATVMNAVHHVPFARIKSMAADITEDDARAKGYIKGNFKKNEVFTLLKRTTEPTTVYKKQKMDRDDQVDITDFDVVSWLKTEMRMMLNEEIARAILIGDGRLSSSDDKIAEDKIRPIWKDHELYAIHHDVDTTGDLNANFIDEAVRARKDYKGSGNPILFTTEDILTECLLLKDEMGHRLYKTVDELATAMRVKDIVTVEVMENQTGEDGKTLLGIIVNLKDYYVGADKGGSINMFEDFDIDYNQNKYLIETRCSGALVKPYSAIVLEAELG